jgi:glutaryl-CoA dehydrogenase
MWITNGNLADIAIVWAQTDEGIQGFILEKGIRRLHRAGRAQAR